MIDPEAPLCTIVTAETCCTNVVFIVRQNMFDPTAGILAHTRRPVTPGNSALQLSKSMSGSTAPEHRNIPCTAVDQESPLTKSEDAKLGNPT